MSCTSSSVVNTSSCTSVVGVEPVTSTSCLVEGEEEEEEEEHRKSGTKIMAIWLPPYSNLIPTVNIPFTIVRTASPSLTASSLDVSPGCLDLIFGPFCLLNSM